ncbi:TIGR03086 family metal-binding protein [Natronoglycomyces albus]|uniref:TIGR03086 family protein n=1 Tax=Natronoglycomyces albus TaxID=2811108 RepID=A0A895XTR1_9ACTN|nr:TIGR03086 family metal-binding protein [Natronoglycomyces albus]QSB06689.1 TIGR03086 family protein [Natronoglycomyces albus]
MTGIDLEPATRKLNELIEGVWEKQLSVETPCQEMAVGDLLEHIGALAKAFTAAANKENDAQSGPPPKADAARLPMDWRAKITGDLETLAEAWRKPEAWEGHTYAGGLKFSGAEAGVVALDELVLHSWDLAVATNQEYEPDPQLVAIVDGFVSQFSGPGTEEAREGLFGPEREIPDDAPLFHRVLGKAGRDPHWTPPVT